MEAGSTTEVEKSFLSSCLVVMDHVQISQDCLCLYEKAASYICTSTWLKRLFSAGLQELATLGVSQSYKLVKREIAKGEGW